MLTFLESLQAPALVGAMVLMPMAIAAALLFLWKRFARNRNRRSPLTSELLRAPGFGLQERIEELTWDFSSHILALTWIPLMFFGMYQLKTHMQTDVRVDARMFAFAATALLIYQLVMLIRRVDERQRYREALAGELATAQLLEPIIASGGRVLHDIQAPTFNIDHVVIAPGGVFAVETKHRLKPSEGKGKEQARVTFDGKGLRFPGWAETAPIEQARAQARWLSERLTKSTGLAVQARPVIALPGWFVEVTAPSDVVVTNPKACRFMLRPRSTDALLDSEKIQRIAYQVEQLCRMPAPGVSQEHSRRNRRDRKARRE